MARLNLHPCAARMSWLSDHPLTDADWGNALCGFLSKLGENCIAGGGSLIGHIKGVATIAGSPVLQLSLVSLGQAVSVSGSIPDRTSELQLTLNVLVFGLSASDLTTFLKTTRDQLVRSWPGSIELEILPAATGYPLVVHGEGCGQHTRDR